ncbi:MAG: thioredoxin [Microthrixaceae bacterium]
MTSTVLTCPDCNTRNRVPDATSGTPRCASCHANLPWLIEADARGFSEVTASSSLPVVVDLWAPWCGPCRMVAPELERLAAERAGSLRVVKVNVDEAPSVSAQLGVQGIPTLLLFAGGSEVGRQVGALPGPALRGWIDETLASR